MWKNFAGVCLAWLALSAAMLPAQRVVNIAPCAQENGRCSFSGNAWILFGAGTQFSVKQLTDGTACTNAVFGDPDNRVVKSCYEIPASVRFNKCAAESGECSFKGARVVIYGAENNYAGRLVSNKTVCGNAVFGDPAPNMAKGCMVLNAELAFSAGAPAALSITYVTLQMRTGGNLFLKFLPSGSLDTDIQARMSYFALLASHSPPASGDVIRLGDFSGQWVLTMQPNGALAMVHGQLASGAALRMTTTSTPAGLAVDLQAPDNRFLVRNGSGFGLQKAATPSSTMNLRFFTRAQVNEDMAKGQAQEDTKARPEFGPGVN